MTTPLERLLAGYWNSGLYSPSNPGGLSGEGALRLNWPLTLADIAAVATDAATANAQAAAYAAAAVNAPGTSATSVSNVTLPAAAGVDLTFTLAQANKAFIKGQTLVFGSDADPLKQAVGPITAFNAATGVCTIRVLYVSATGAGAGPYAAWNIGLAPPVDGTLTGRVTALETELARLNGRRRLQTGDLL